MSTIEWSVGVQPAPTALQDDWVRQYLTDREAKEQDAVLAAATNRRNAARTEARNHLREVVQSTQRKERWASHANAV